MYALCDKVSSRVRDSSVDPRRAYVYDFNLICKFGFEPKPERPLKVQYLENNNQK